MCNSKALWEADSQSTASPTNAFELRSEEHTSELQSRVDLVCRLLLEKKKKQTKNQQRQKNRTHRHKNRRHKMDQPVSSDTCSRLHTHTNQKITLRRHYLTVSRM